MMQEPEQTSACMVYCKNGIIHTVYHVKQLGAIFPGFKFHYFRVPGIHARRECKCFTGSRKNWNGNFAFLNRQTRPVWGGGRDFARKGHADKGEAKGKGCHVSNLQQCQNRCNCEGLICVKKCTHT